MSNLTSYDFLKAAQQRLLAAEVLLDARMTLDAQYVAGYTIECALKALIMHLTPSADVAAVSARITTGAHMHRTEVLLGELRQYNVRLPLELIARLRRFPWTTDLRYRTGRVETGEAIGFLRTARLVLEWVRSQIP